MFHKLDNTQLASIGVSEGKANTALRFKRPSKALDDAIATGGAGLRLLAALIARGICAETCSLSLTAIRRASSPVSSSAAARASRLLLEIDVGERLPISIKDDKAPPIQLGVGPRRRTRGGRKWRGRLGSGAPEPWLIVPSVFPMGWVLVLNLSEPLSSSSFSSSEPR
jgi:hypothetical protein